MKKLLNELFKSFLIILILFFTAFIYYLYIPASARHLSQQIDSSDPNILDDTRLNLSSQLEQYLSRGLPANKTPTLLHLFLGNQRKLLDLRIKQAVTDVRDTKLSTNQAKVTTFLNMGAIVKTAHHTIGFDLANMPLSLAHQSLVDSVDIFLVTHGDSDHYDPTLLQQALESGKTVIFPNDFYFTHPNPESSRVYWLTDGQQIDLDGVQITAFQTDHRLDRNFDEPNAWYLVAVDGFKVLHTGDGIEFKNRSLRQQLNQSTDIDIFLVNSRLHPFDVRDIGPQLAIPLHLFKFLHNQEELSQSTFAEVSQRYRQYPSDLQGIDFKFLFPGESFIFHH